MEAARHARPNDGQWSVLMLLCVGYAQHCPFSLQSNAILSSVIAAFVAFSRPFTHRRLSLKTLVGNESMDSVGPHVPMERSPLFTLGLRSSLLRSLMHNQFSYFYFLFISKTTGAIDIMGLLLIIMGFCFFFFLFFKTPNDKSSLNGPPTLVCEFLEFFLRKVEVWMTITVYALIATDRDKRGSCRGSRRSPNDTEKNL